MSNNSNIELATSEKRTLKVLSAHTKTKIPASYTANRLMGRKEIERYLENDRIDPCKNERVQKEEIALFLNNGGEGIDLSFEEECLIYGIANLFSNNDYPEYIECTEKELFKALKNNKKPCGWERQKRRKMLENLSNKRFPIYWSEEEGNRIWRWLTYDVLIKLAWGIETENGNLEFKPFPTKENFSRYKIAFNEKLIGRLRNNFRLGNPDIIREIREYRKGQGKKASKYDIRFYYLLLHENKKVIKRNYLKIAQAPLLMRRYIKDRKFKFIREKINSIYRMYADLGYLSNYYINHEGARYNVDILILNPDKFYRLRDEKE